MGTWSYSSHNNLWKGIYMKKLVLLLLSFSLLLHLPIAAADCPQKQEREEAYRKLVETKFIHPQKEQTGQSTENALGSLLLLSREVIDPMTAQACGSGLKLENGTVIEPILDSATGQKTKNAYAIKFQPQKLLQNTVLGAETGRQSVEFEYKETAPYIKLWVENKGETSFRVRILPKGVFDGPDALYQDDFTVKPHTSQVIYYFGDPQNKNKGFQFDIVSADQMPLNGTLAMKEFTKVIKKAEELEQGFYQVFEEMVKEPEMKK